MLSRLMARQLAKILVPEKVSATVKLYPGTTHEETVSVKEAWLKPYGTAVMPGGGTVFAGESTIINIMDHELNPAGNGREIHTNDQIIIGTQTYIVGEGGADLKSVRTRWMCRCRKIGPAES